MYISKEMVAAFLVMAFVLVILGVISVGAIIWGVSYDRGYKDGMNAMELRGGRFPHRRDTKIKNDLKIIDLDKEGLGDDWV